MSNDPVVTSSLYKCTGQPTSLLRPSMTADSSRNKPQNAYRRNGPDWPYGDASDVAVPVSDRLAVLSDGIFLRRTPPDQPTVDEVIHEGSLITGNYRWDGHISEVYRVLECEVYGMPTYRLLVSEPGSETSDSGLPKRYRGGNIKELVYQDGAIRKLFANNTKEIRIVEESRSESYQSGFGEWSG